MKRLTAVTLLILFSGLLYISSVGKSLAADEDGPMETFKAKAIKITDWYEAVGTIRPRVESRIEAQVAAQVIDVKVRPGDKVKKGMLLLTLDNRKLLSRLDQAKQGLKSSIAGKKQSKQGVVAAKVAFKQAQSDYNRIKTNFQTQTQAATIQRLEEGVSTFLLAQARLNQAKEALSGVIAKIEQAEEVVKEANIALEHTNIRAPADGEVLKRLVEPGDLALPGKPLLLLKTTGLLRLEAHVREGLIRKVKPGIKLRAVITTLDAETDARVEEVVPYADPGTRTFIVKASIPDMDGLYPGMFGKLLIPLTEHDVIVIPKTYIRNVGQLELVSVKEDQGWKTRYVKTGKKIQDMVEVLSGLSKNEIIGFFSKE